MPKSFLGAAKSTMDKMPILVDKMILRNRELNFERGKIKTCRRSMKPVTPLSPRPPAQITLSRGDDYSVKKSTRFIILSIAREHWFWEFVFTHLQMKITGVELYTVKSGDTGASGAALPVNGRISLDPDRPGFGVELKRELLAPFKG